MRVILCVLIVALSFAIRADQYTDYKGITWTYSVTDAPSWESWWDGYATLTGVSGASGDVTIPGSFSVTTGSYDENWSWVEKTKTYQVNEIQSGCFSGCSQITSLYIPELLLMSINRDTFNGCTGLKAFKTSEYSYGSYKVKDGLMLYGWSENSMSLYMVPAGLSDVVILDGVSSIDADAFYGCNSLQSITIPTSISRIDSNSFYGGKLPSKIYFKSGDGMRVKSMFSDARISMPDTAFVRESNHYNSLYIVDDSTWVCSKLNNSTLEIVGTKNLTGGVVVPSEIGGVAISTIGAWLFECCSELTSVIISNGVTTIGQGAFADCVALSSIGIPNSVVSIEANAFRNTAILNSALPGLVIASNAVIGVKEPCPELVVIPSNIHVVADGALANSPALKKICTDVGDASRISNMLASAGVSFATVDIVEKATVLFDANGGVCDVNSTTHVPGEAYGALPYPEREGFVFVGWYTAADGGTIVNADTISAEDCKKQTLYAHWETPTWLYSVNSDNTITITGCTCVIKGKIILPGTIDGRTVTGLGSSVLSGNADVEGITLPDSIIHVSVGAFNNTGYWNNSGNGFVICGKVLIGYKCASSEYPTSLAIPEGVRVIANGAFSSSYNYNMYRLTTVTFPASLTHIGKSAFYGLNKIGSLSFQHGLIEIDDQAFSGCSILSSVNIPNTIKRIGYQAFYQSRLSYVSIQATDLVICEDAFRYDESAASSASAGISLTGSGIEVGDRAFYDYRHGKGIVLDLTGVSKIGNYAFGYAGYNSAYRYSNDGFYDIGSVELRISDQLQHASTNAFNWAAVGRVKVPSWNTVYGRPGWLNFLSQRTSAGSPYEGFYCRLIVNDEYITSVKIPEGTVSIPEKAFKGLRLERFEVPASVKTIGDQAFACTRSTIQFDGQPPTCSGTPFIGCDSGGYSQSVKLWREEIVDSKWNGLLVSEGDVYDYSDAMDAPGIEFSSTGGFADWFVQAADTHDGTRAMRSNSDIRNGAGLKCEIMGPATLSYWWKLNKVTSGYNKNWLGLYIDGTFVTNITSNAIWEQVRLEVGSGIHDVEWSYDGVECYHNYSGEAGFVDGVSVLYDVHFDVGDGSLISGELDQKVKPGEIAAVPTVRAAPGRIFVGWSKDIQQITGPTTYVAMYREPTIAETLNVPGNSRMQFTNDISFPWTVSDTAHDGSMSLKSGKTGDGEKCELMATFKGEGMLSFFWKASTEVYKSTAIDYGVLLVDGIEKARIGGERDWAEVEVEILGPNSHTIVWRYQKDEADFAGEDCIWVDEVNWLPVDPIPELSLDASPAEVRDALEGSADTKLSENITDSVTYGAYREWAKNVKAKGGLSPVGAESVKNSSNAWLSFALGSEVLIENAPADGDLKVDAFEPATESGKFDFTVSVKDIEIGSDAIVENLKKVFGLEGGTTLEDGGLSSANVDITFGAPADGKVKFTAGPNAKNADAKTFFMKVKMAP